jgi:hypothetical protein
MLRRITYIKQNQKHPEAESEGLIPHTPFKRSSLAQPLLKVVL